MGKKIKLAILSVAAGAGHVRAAQPLEQCVADNYLEIEAVHLDVMNYVPKLFRKLYAEADVRKCCKNQYARCRQASIKRKY
ncbi:MAG: hypothetical protein L3J71_11780 [Victivallaceae bacterium]|nr:hypothetical protein [Victivallaceae bacterium]